MEILIAMSHKVVSHTHGRKLRTAITQNRASLILKTLSMLKPCLLPEKK